jgi:hypothetical protein
MRTSKVEEIGKGSKQLFKNQDRILGKSNIVELIIAKIPQKSGGNQ